MPREFEVVIERDEEGYPGMMSGSPRRARILWLVGRAHAAKRQASLTLAGPTGGRTRTRRSALQVLGMEGLQEGGLQARAGRPALDTIHPTSTSTIEWSDTFASRSRCE